MLEVKSELYVSDEVSASKLFDIDIKESDDGDMMRLSQRKRQQQKKELSVIFK